MTETERREFLKAAGASLAGVVGMSVLGCNPGTTEIRDPTREELVKRLEKLAQSKPPKNLSIGAMCYKMAPPIFVQMPCPDCERTMQVGEKDEILREYNVPLKRIQDQGVDAKLILPEHCPTCGFGLGLCGLTWEQKSELLSSGGWKQNCFHLEIRYSDHPSPVRVELTNGAYDLELMALFLQGKDRYNDGQDRETALKDQLERLKELFGVKDQP